MYLKENIKLLRKRRKRSQEEVSANIGLTRSAYCSSRRQNMFYRYYKNKRTHPKAD
jgi:transcriptional regulator with XRE-family HTH domain